MYLDLQYEKYEKFVKILWQHRSCLCKVKIVVFLCLFVFTRFFSNCIYQYVNCENTVKKINKFSLISETIWTNFSNSSIMSLGRSNLCVIEGRNHLKNFQSWTEAKVKFGSHRNLTRISLTEEESGDSFY